VIVIRAHPSHSEQVFKRRQLSISTFRQLSFPANTVNMLEIEPLLSADPSAESSRLIQRSEKALAAALLAGSARPVRAAISFLKLKVAAFFRFSFVCLLCLIMLCFFV
jgi:hypothetical protein